MKVFVLITESVTDYEPSQTPIENECRVFETHEKAVEVMNSEYKAELADWEKTYTDDAGNKHIENEITQCTAYIAVEFRYDESHIRWNIKECETIK